MTGSAANEDEGTGARHPVGGAPPPADPDQDLPAVVDGILSAYLRQRGQQSAACNDQFAAEVVWTLTDLVFRGGKRLRPAFLWWGWRGCGGDADGPLAEGALQAAAALELVQTCALLHDDLMDGSALRRGAPAAHITFADRHRAAGLRGDSRTFGSSVALLAGDLALAWADDLWEAAQPDESARRRVREPWRAMRTEMVAGQYLDLRGQAARTSSPQAALETAHLKSGLYTVQRPLHLGAAMAGAGPEILVPLMAAGRDAGLAFQLRDDLLGVFADPTDTGKPAGEDIREGKRTYLVTVAQRRAEAPQHQAAGRRLQQLLGRRELSAAELQDVRDLIGDLGARTVVEERIASLTSSALAALKRARLTAAATSHLAAMVCALAERTT